MRGLIAWLAGILAIFATGCDESREVKYLQAAKQADVEDARFVIYNEYLDTLKSERSSAERTPPEQRSATVIARLKELPGEIEKQQKKVDEQFAIVRAAIERRDALATK